MAKKNNPPKRLPNSFIEDMERALNTRVKLGLMSYKDAKFPKGVELLRRTQGYQLSLEELKTKKEKKKWIKKHKVLELYWDSLL